MDSDVSRTSWRANVLKFKSVLNHWDEQWVSLAQQTNKNEGQDGHKSLQCSGLSSARQLCNLCLHRDGCRRLPQVHRTKTGLTWTREHFSSSCLSISLNEELLKLLLSLLQSSLQVLEV